MNNSQPQLKSFIEKNKNLFLLCQLALATEADPSELAIQQWDDFPYLEDWLIENEEELIVDVAVPNIMLPDVCNRCYADLGLTLAGRVRSKCPKCTLGNFRWQRTTTERFYDRIQETFGFYLIEALFSVAILYRKEMQEK